MINRILGAVTGGALAFTLAANSLPSARMGEIDGVLFMATGAALGYLLGLIADGVSRL